MSLSSEQEQLVVYIDQQVRQSLSDTGSPAEILMGLALHMKEVKELIDEIQENERAVYCQKYEGFHFFITLLEGILSAMTSEKVIAPTYH